ncbi:MAG: hypothetical protein IKI49_06475 [Oscillospiraceae bacterium]|nr:hypothetical protein [Oscillospiraceae bacterium]
MKLPRLKYSDGIKKTVQTGFGGYNHTPAAGDGELWDMENMSSASYPLLSPRPRRRLVYELSSPGCIFGHEKLLYIDGTQLYYGGVLRGEVTAGDKRIAALGERLVIFPDKVVLNVRYERIGVYATVSELQSAVPSPVRGDAYGVGSGCPYEIFVWDGESWLSNGLELQSLESAWSGSSLEFKNGTLYGESAAANTVKNSAVNWRNYFRAGDAVTISGCTLHPKNNKTPIIREISDDGHEMRFYENVFELTGADGTTAYTETGAISVKRTVPDLTDVCVSDNRVWGCMGDTIYCCALGDPFNWNVFDGIETDAWACETGTPGDFNACRTYLGYPIFFKDDTVCKVYGSLPSNFSPMSSATLGVVKGGIDSIAAAGEILFYLSKAGIVAYSGGVPTAISAPFGDVRYTEAVGGSDGLKYYVSMRSAEGEWSLFTYDTTVGKWYREDALHAMGMAYADGNLHILAYDGKLWLSGNITDAPPGSVEEDRVHWYAEFGDFTDMSPNAKAVSKIQLRLELDVGSSVEVQIKYDSEGEWVTAGSVSTVTKRSVYLPVVPRRADHYRLRLEGVGGCRIYSISKEFYTGSAIETK